MGFLLGFPGMTLLTAGPCRITIRPGTPREDDNSRGIKDPITFEHQSIFLVAQAGCCAGVGVCSTFLLFSDRITSSRLPWNAEFQFVP